MHDVTDQLTDRRKRYERFESLGQNDYLTVYRGWDRELRRFIAIMELDRRFTNGPQYDQIWNEVLSFAAIEHYGLVRVYEVDKRQGWIITELMTGPVAIERANSGLLNKQARVTLRTALDALGSLHQHGKVHGDVRPPNLLVDENGNVRLSHPIGLAVGGQVPRRTMNQKYLAPELIKPDFGEPGPASDLYCLGFSLYSLLVGPKVDELVTGTKLQSGTTGNVALNWLRWHASDEAQLPSIKTFVPNVADDIGHVIDQLVAKRVADRPTAEAALSQLKEIDLNEPVFAASGVLHPPSADVEDSPSKREVRPQSEHRGVTSNMNHNRREAVKRPIQAGSPTRTSPPKSRPTLEEKLRKPWVFRTLSAAVLVAAVWIGLALRPKGPDPTPVPSTPGEAPLAGTTPPSGSVPVTPGTEIAQLREIIQSSQNETKRLAGELQKILEKLGQTIPVGPDSPPLPATPEGLALLNQSIVRLNEALTHSSEQQESLIDAINLLREHVAAKPIVPLVDPNGVLTSAEEYQTRAAQRLELRDFDGVIADLEAATRLAPESADSWLPDIIEAYYYRGRSLMKDEATYRNADDDFTHVLELDPRHLKAYYYRGRIRRALGQLAPAIEDFNRAFAELTSATDNAPNGTQRTTLRFRPITDDVVQVEQVLLYRGRTYGEQNKHKEAISDLTESIRRSPNLAPAYVYRGISQHSLGQYQDALVDFDQAVRLGDSSYKTFNNRGCCYLCLRDFDSAVRDFSQAIKIDTRISDAYFNRYLAYRQKGWLDEAQIDLDQARRLNPSIYRVEEKPSKNRATSALATPTTQAISTTPTLNLNL